MKFTQDNLKQILLECASYEDDVYYETRKGVPQSFYVLSVPRDSMFWNWESDKMELVPEWSIGYWKTEFASDYTKKEWRQAVKDDDWVRTQKKEVITYFWE